MANAPELPLDCVSKKMLAAAERRGRESAVRRARNLDDMQIIELAHKREESRLDGGACFSLYVSEIRDLICDALRVADAGKHDETNAAAPQAAPAGMVLVPRETLKWWRDLVDLNPADLAPRIDRMLAAAPAAQVASPLSHPLAPEGGTYSASPAVVVDEDAENWIDRAAFCANELLATALHRIEPVRDESGSTLNHCRWMAEELAAKRVGSETKACRWLGYIQGQLIAWCMSTLECEKDRNLRSAALAAALNQGKGNG